MSDLPSLVNNPTKLLYKCEQHELKMTGEDASKETETMYCLHLLALLQLDDTNNARYLWKRIPDAVKKQAALVAVWEVGQALIRNDYTKFFALGGGGKFGKNVAPFVEALVKQVRSRRTSLLAKAYSSVSLKQVASELGMSAEQSSSHVGSLGWTVEGDFCLPPNCTDEQKTQDAGVEQLAQLTEYVLHLEEKVLQDVDVDYDKIDDELKNNTSKKGKSS